MSTAVPTQAQSAATAIERPVLSAVDPPVVSTAEAARAGDPAITLDPRTFERGLSCVHCGLCLPACPTFTQTGHEADSPRGRIQLMLGLSTGAIQPTESVRKHLDLCLDCRGCETACPSGVVYHELIEETRAKLSPSQALPLQQRLMRWTFFHVFVYPSRLRWAILPARILQKMGIYPLFRKAGLFRLLPASFRKMEQMLPAHGPIWPKLLPERTPHRDTGFQPVPTALEWTSTAQSAGSASEDRRHGLKTRVTDRQHGPNVVATIARKQTIGFFAGCIGSILFDDVNRQAIELLAACGAEVLAPPGQVCCGAIHQHSGQHKPAEAFARRNIDTFCPKDGPPADFIATNIAGCGSMLREYDLLLRDDPEYAARSKQFAARVRDISEVLLMLGLPEMKHPINQTATYHDACHLAHAQKVTAAPRKLLAQIPGLNLVPLPDSDMCCGAAGTYNLTQPQMSAALAERKVKNIESTGASLCITGNVGCAMQIQSEAQARGQKLTVLHPVQVIHRAIFGN